MPESTPPSDVAVTAASESDPIRDKAIRLFRYLSALAELRAKMVRDVASHEAVFWFSELPREKECYTPAWDDGETTDEENWLRIDKPVKPPLPPPPAECEHWFDAASLEDISAEPKLHDEIVDPRWVPGDKQPGDECESTPPRRLPVSDHPHVALAWGKYLETKWHPWSVQYQRWQRIQRAYRKLFAIYQEQQRRGEQYELVLGVGILVWTAGSGHKICRPIVTARVTITLERESGCISVVPALDGVDFRLEQDMMEVNERPPIQDQKPIEQRVSALASPWNRREITPILKGWLQTLPSAADATYQGTLQCPERATRTPQMAFAPVLILRKRGAQTMRDVLRKIVAQLSEGTRIPRGIRNLCDLGDGSESRHNHPSEAGDSPEPILFPLPTNDEQLAIIRHLGGRSGVLVQGPPGTGKSHTIVNLVSHLLASGKRVLVTSQTPRALRVLRDKIPEAILPLTVSLLGEDAESRQNLEHSVQGILRHVNTTNPTDAQWQIHAKTRERQSLQARLADLRRRLREIREAETTVFSVPGTPYQGTAQAIAQAVSRDSERFSWLPDQVGEETEPPLTDEQFKELYSLWEQCRSNSLAYTLPALDTLPTEEDFENAIDACSRARSKVATLGDKAMEAREQRLLPRDRKQLQQLCKIAQQLIGLSDWLAKREEPWIDQVREGVCVGRTLPWSSLESATSKALESVGGPVSAASHADLETSAQVSRAQLLADAADLLSHLQSGGGLAFWPFRARVVRRCTYLWRESRYMGKRCDSPPVLKCLIAHLRAQETLDRAWQEWTQIVEPPKGTMRHRIACLEQCRDVLRAILRLNNLISAAAKIVGEAEASRKAASGTNGGENLLRNAQVALALLDVKEAEAALSGITDTVSQCRNLENPHPFLNDLVVAAEQGNVEGYREKLAALAGLHRERCLAERCLFLDKRLRQSAPNLADAIKGAETRPVLAASVDSFGSAWAWKRATAWLDRFSAEHSADIADEIARTERQLQQTTQTLVALKAWRFCMEKLATNPTQQAALTAWQQMVKRIGKGTGKYAETYRRDARKYMQQCRNAIPAWIMPLYRVAEQVEAEPEVFDVVIVDEASQTGPEGLILQYLGRQCVIVGDDKQISPEAVGVERSHVRILMEQHLDGIPFSETLDPLTSLFDQAAVRYGNRIPLREHFRCMPEIIRFSNELCYTDTPLIPLRQYPPSRLPPIQVRFVVDGYREGTAQDVINRPEAAAVAKTVIDSLNDPRYKGKSFGVICLQGHAQARLIETMILEKIGPQPFKDEKTRLLCGEPYSFQGDERDVVFLSMVASVEGEGRSAPLIREPFRQRFNVAASRARDQLWMFHSVRESDLHPNCMRRRLLHFCYNPNASTTNQDGQRYESDFEREVAEELLRAGFRVIPQYEVAEKRIDLVVEDRERRLAVECDGDAWHGPDQYEADMARQRMLERCGWKFIRIRGSVFYANRSKAAGELIEDIRAHGIEPHAVTDDEAVPRNWVEEVSGSECMEALGAHTVDIAEENIVQQRELFPEESEESTASEATVATPRVTAAEASERRLPQPTTRLNPAGVDRLLDVLTPEAPKAASPPTPPTRMSKSAATFVTAEERKAILTALDKAGKPLVVWMLCENSKISQRRLEEILPVLVSEGFVKRVDAADAVRYSLA